MPYYRKYIYSGEVLEMHEYYSIRQSGVYRPRGKNENISTEMQKDINLRNTKKQVDRLLNANFDKKDFFITHTYEQDTTAEAAERELVNYFRRLNYRCKKLGHENVKYIAVTESKGRRRHHHIILKCALPLDVIMDTWGAGRTHVGRLDNSKDYQGLSRYITKDLDIESPKGKKRYKASRNLEKPIVVKKTVKKFVRDWRPPKGYVYVQHPDYVASDVNGLMRYARAIKIGGHDIAGGFGKDVLRE